MLKECGGMVDGVGVYKCLLGALVFDMRVEERLELNTLKGRQTLVGGVKQLYSANSVRTTCA